MVGAAELGVMAANMGRRERMTSISALSTTASEIPLLQMNIEPQGIVERGYAMFIAQCLLGRQGTVNTLKLNESPKTLAHRLS